MKPKPKMLDVAKLKEELSGKFAEVEAAATKLEEAETDATKSAAQEVYGEKKAEFDELKGRVDEAKSHAQRVKLMREVNDLASSDGGSADDLTRSRTVPAEARDHVAEGQSHCKAFYDWIAGKSISGQEWDLIRPKSQPIASREDVMSKQDAAVAPPSLSAKLAGRNYAETFDLDSKVVSTLLTGNPSAAYNLVPQEFRRQLLQLPYDAPTILNQVTIIPSATGTLTIPQLVQTDTNEFGAVSFSWTEEAGTKPETEPRFAQVNIDTFELCGYTEISERALSRSAIALEPLLAALYRGAMNFAIDNVILNGTGVAQPLGIVNTAGIRTVARNAASIVSDTDLVNLKHAVKPAHRGGARYFLADSVEQRLELTNDTLGRPLFRASTAGGPYDRLVGFPYDISQNSPTIGNTGDVIFGNPKWYWLVMEEEIVIARSEHAQFRRNVVAFKVYVVVGGRAVEPRAFSILGPVSS